MVQRSCGAGRDRARHPEVIRADILKGSPYFLHGLWCVACDRARQFEVIRANSLKGSPCLLRGLWCSLAGAAAHRDGLVGRLLEAAVGPGPA